MSFRLVCRSVTLGWAFSNLPEAGGEVNRRFPSASDSPPHPEVEGNHNMQWAGS